MSESVTTNLCPSAPVWDRTCGLQSPDDLDLAAEVVRLVDRIPGLDAEEVARILGVDNYTAWHVTAALVEVGILGEAKD